MCKNGNPHISLFEENAIVNSQSDVANILNDHFINAANNLSENIDIKSLSLEEINQHLLHK